MKGLGPNAHTRKHRPDGKLLQSFLETLYREWVNVAIHEDDTSHPHGLCNSSRESYKRG